MQRNVVASTKKKNVYVNSIRVREATMAGEKKEKYGKNGNRMQMQILATAVKLAKSKSNVCKLPAACRSANKNERNLYADAKAFCTPFAGNSHQEKRGKRKNRWWSASFPACAFIFRFASERGVREI